MRGLITNSFRNRGAEANNWRGGTSFEDYSLDWQKNLRNKIRIRDKNKCKVCDKTSEQALLEFKQNLHVHHIDYNKKNCEESNLISLCLKCHMKTNYNRDYWYQLLTEENTLI